MTLRIALAALALVMVVCLSGCMSVASPAIGILYTDVRGPLGGTSMGSKEGKACAESFLGLIARGDASIEAAAKAGGITKITMVNHHTENIFGLMGKYCTVVRGT